MIGEIRCRLVLDQDLTLAIIDCLKDCSEALQRTEDLLEKLTLTVDEDLIELKGVTK